MIYHLIWNNEVIDTASTKFQAISLKKEYCIAFNTTRIEIRPMRVEWEKEFMKSKLYQFYMR